MQRFTLIIPKPCHEDWNKMTPVEKGKFCGNCAKEVVDFTQMSDAQLIGFFKKPSGESVCGRFMNAQLQRNIVIPRKPIPWIKYFFTVAIPAVLFTSRVPAQQSTGAGNNSSQAVAPPLYFAVEKLTVPVSVEKYIRIINGEGTPIVNASVLLKGTSRGFLTDTNGCALLSIDFLKDSSTLIISAFGRESKEIKITDLNFSAYSSVSEHKSSADIATITLNEVDAELTGAIVIIRRTRSIKDTLTKATRLLGNRGVANESQLLVSPNPAVAGGMVSIDCKKLRKGYYSLQVVSADGKQVMNKNILIDVKANTIPVTGLPGTSGTYFISLTSANTGKKYSAVLLIAGSL